MRIRTDGKHAYRADTIKQAAELWGCNKTTALMKSADFTHRMDSNIREVLARDDLTPKQECEIAETLRLPGTYTVEVTEDIKLTVE